jgi:hypothetical protein
MKYSMLAIVMFLIPSQPMVVQAGDTPAEGDRFDDPRKAKSAAAKIDSVDVMIGDYDLTVSGEFVRVSLDEGQVYRVEFDARSGGLEIRPRRSHEQPALPLIIEDIPRASGTRAIEIAPRQDGEYDFRVLGVSGVGARLKIFREVKPSERWRRISNRAEEGKPGV